MKKRVILVNDKMQRGYRYLLTEPMGKNLDSDFKPELTPKRGSSARTEPVPATPFAPSFRSLGKHARQHLRDRDAWPWHGAAWGGIVNLAESRSKLAVGRLPFGIGAQSRR
jgi:hypothetical protein